MRLAFTLIILTAFTAALASQLCFPSEAIKKKNPNLQSRWENQMYELDADENLRFIPQPAGGGQFSSTVEGAAVNKYISSSADGTISSAIRICGWTEQFSLTEPDWEIDGELGSAAVIGDWMVRANAPQEHRARVLQSILAQVTGRDIIIERKRAPRDVIVIRGHWRFRPVDLESLLAKTVHLYTDDSSPAGRSFRRAWSGPEALLHRIKDFTDCYTFDETEGQIPSSIQWQDDLPMHCVRLRGETNSDTDRLLDNLSKQTSLEFKQSTRMIPVWFIRERTVAEQPDNGK
jgi:hypothetical protein